VVDDRGESVAWQESDRPERASCVPCRFGSSGVKPYFDGTQAVVGLDGTPDPVPGYAVGVFAKNVVVDTVGVTLTGAACATSRFDVQKTT